MGYPYKLVVRESFMYFHSNNIIPSYEYQKRQGIWFTVSYGAGIIFKEALDQFQIGGFKLGFWFAQQGAIYVFVIPIFFYIHLMDRLDKKYCYDHDSKCS